MFAWMRSYMEIANGQELTKVLLIYKMNQDALLLIADSGSTKTDWALRSDAGDIHYFRTSGLNPFILGTDELVTTIGNEVVPHISNFINRIVSLRFYGAGCREQGAERMSRALKQIFEHATVDVASDMLGAARALLGREAGIACILGTGSNSCLFDGKTIVRSIPSLGYILGDEGSGAVLGRKLLAGIFKKQLPDELCSTFNQEYMLLPEDVMENVYRRPFPNRYMAGFVPFIKKHIDDVSIQNLVLEEFSRFFERNICAYRGNHQKVSFVGGIAYNFKEQLQLAALHAHYEIGQILNSPFDKIENL